MAQVNLAPQKRNHALTKYILLYASNLRSFLTVKKQGHKLEVVEFLKKYTLEIP